MKYTVLLSDGTVGTICMNNLNEQLASDFIGKVVRVQLYDESGHHIEREGTLVEFLDVSSD